MERQKNTFVIITQPGEGTIHFSRQLLALFPRQDLKKLIEISLPDGTDDMI